MEKKENVKFRGAGIPCPFEKGDRRLLNFVTTYNVEEKNSIACLSMLTIYDSGKWIGVFPESWFFHV